MITIFFRASLLFIAFFSVTACQQVQKKSKQDISEINAILRNITIEALKKKDFEQANRSINAYIISADAKSWNFLQSAIISLPKEMAYKTIQKALENPQVNQSSGKMFRLAKIYISYQKTELALDTINKSIALDAKNHQARYWRARLLTVMKKYDLAEKDFKYIIKKQPNNEEFSGQYASFLQETKQFDKAQIVLAGLKQSPDGLFKRIIFALQNENKETAKLMFSQLKAMEVKPDKKNHLNFLTGEAAYWLKDNDQSETYYRKVNGGDNYLDARDMLSLILFEEEKYDESIEILHQLQNAEEKYALKAYRLESQINKKLGNTDDAIETLSRSLEILPNNPILLYDRAMLFESIGNMTALEKDLLQIIKDDPRNHEAYNALGYSLVDHDMKLEEGYKYIQKAMKLAPNNAAVIDSMGWAQYKLGKFKEAEISFLRALEMDINDPELFLHLYHTQLKLNKAIQANKTLQEAYEKFPENSKILKLIK